MASIILRSRIPSTILKTCSSSISTTSSNLADISKAACQKDAKQIKKELALMKREDILQKQEYEKSTITISQPSEISAVSGIPEEHVKSRRVRIFMPAKNAMQSGTDNTHHWSMEFETRERWENPLMGWSSSGDPLSNINVDFATKDDAIAFCEKNGWPWFVQEPKTERPMKPKSYGINFSWDKRTRVSTK